MSELWRRLAALLRRGRLDRDLDEEMRIHLEMQADENGDPAAARRAFGNPSLLREQSADLWGWRWLEDFGRDIRLAVRMLRKDSGFTAVAVLILTLGIGANVTVFSVLNAVLLRSLPVEDPRRLVTLLPEGFASYPDYLDLRAQAASFDAVCALYPNARATLGGDNPERVTGEVVTANHFDVAGVRLALGRAFVPEDDRVPNPVVVLNHALWRRRFRAAPDILGKTVLLNNKSYSVIGVAPEGFQGTRRGFAADFWVPVSMAEQIFPWAAKAKLLGTRDQRGFTLVGRLKRGVSPERAVAEVRVINERIYRQAGMRPPRTTLSLAQAGAVSDSRGRQVVRWTSVLMAAVALLLLIACANVAGLQLARGMARRKEIGIRLAVGAGRGRIIRQLLAESLLLAGAGAAAGLALAVAAARAISRVELPVRERITLDISPDLRVLLFTAALALGTVVASGLAPALRATRQDPVRGLKEDATGRVAGFGPRSLLVAAQVALSVVLVAGAGLFLRSLWKLLAIDPGFRPNNVLLLNLDPRFQGYSEDDAARLFRSIEERLAGLPGVRSVSVVSIPPLSMYTSGRGFWADRPGDDKIRQLNVVVVSAGYFQTVGIPITQGRGFNRTGREPQAVISMAAARLFFEGENPLGRRILTYNRNRAYEVVGVVPDAKIGSITEEPAPCMYQLLDQEPGATAYGMSVLVKTAADPRAMIGPVREQIAVLDRGLALYGVETMSAHIEKTLVGAHLSAVLFGTFGAFGLAIAAIGLYGLMSYAVRRRTREIAIRAALGASTARLAGTITMQGMALVVGGIAAGLAAALAATRLISSFLYGVTATDPLTFIATPVVLSIAALAAIAIPARRAARVDPVVALRHE